MARKSPYMMDALVLYLGLITYQSGSIQSAPLSSYLVSLFTHPDPDSNLPFNHIAINNITGDIYIGARERLYQLDAHLNLKQTVDTGVCSFPNSDRFNDNKLLITVITHHNYTLITCGGCGANCQTRNLDDVSVMRELYLTEDVVAIGDLPTVGVVSPGVDLESDGNHRVSGSFYLFTGISSRGRYTSFDFISKHSLLNLQSQQSIRGFFQRESQSKFVHLISYNDYLYYFISRGEETYLGRICRNSQDEDFESYTEIELQCGHAGSQNIIQSAYIGPTGSQLGEAMTFNTTNDLLYALFSSTSSYICVYKMIDVQQSFEDAILGCILGTGSGTENSFLESSYCNRVSHSDMMVMIDC
nr:plexin-A4-like [Lytechinus pictus]